MPLFKTITPNATTQVYIWKVEEPLEELSQNVNLTPHCKARFESMKSELHRRGFLSIRHLLHAAGYTDPDLYYTENGKPHLHDGKHISITHSYNFTAIIVSDAIEVGIDIEMQRDKILRIASRFTPLKEYRTLANDDAVIRKLTIVWGAKESLYKIYGVKGLSFLQHINVTDFDFDDQKTDAVINYHGNQSKYDIDFLEFEGFTCVYALAL
ncbi:4'-phosphopantetheinyl transferase family protein [Leeuwenhoekiella marinoflava]|uniref:4'-phosphopantetheinyl transferase superfamily protein n=2 Tax=Leeuwenhoekiella marinoflava TaxID=988 RepID=A0A4V1KSX1_9FLAO|nr:4'-phosphopantetheinyl transferase superfamily protein [Leeuwenhoekiella marinoflava]RXG33218.1 4'-phosphopantetheinyl transferase superfamily protein [Leeuwenhoekiella marinoflava]SHE43083.1 4'-phosphopantetheinyl transferase superfamily protein [Leeuwenhoekiella marinoflava DSM 3653]